MSLGLSATARGDFRFQIGEKNWNLYSECLRILKKNLFRTKKLHKLWKFISWSRFPSNCQSSCMNMYLYVWIVLGKRFPVIDNVENSFSLFLPRKIMIFHADSISHVYSIVMNITVYV